MKWKNFAEMEIFFNNKILIKYKHVLTKRTHEKKNKNKTKQKNPANYIKKWKQINQILWEELIFFMQYTCNHYWEN